VKQGNRQPTIGNRKTLNFLLCLLCGPLFVLCGFAEAHPQSQIPRIGFLSNSSATTLTARAEAFRTGLRQLGYIEGKTIVVEWRYADGNQDSLPALVAELERLKVQVILTTGATVTRAAKQTTLTTPIVMAQDVDPVANGFVASLARPGGNITGLSTLQPEITGKRLELLKEIVPTLARVAVLGSSSIPGNAQSLKEVEIAAGAFAVKLQYLDVLSPKDIEIAFQAAGRGRAGAVLVFSGPVFNLHRTQTVGLAVKNRLPAIYYIPEYVHDGGLMSYGVSFTDLFRRAAIYVDRILKGAKPADLPVEQPTKFELVINLKTPKQIGLTIPPNVLARADRVIR
jgi:putative tryptophan/tyrosine transport system substrate-binding protein